MKKNSNKKFYIKLIAIALVTFVGGFLIGSIDTSDDCNVVQANTLNADATLEDANSTESEIPNSSDPETPREIAPNADILDSTTTEYLGSEDAPITMIEFTDYQCPYCQRYYFGAFKDILEKYVETGKVKYVMKSLPLPFHSEARPAAYATLCAGEQNALWAMHKRLFMYQNEWAYDDNPTGKFEDYAQEIGLDTKAFASCMDTASKKYDDKINEDSAFAGNYGLSGTPSFVINGTPVIGAQAFEAFANVIDKAQ